MQYQYKIIGLVGKFYEQKTFYKIECDNPYPFSVGDEIIFGDNWKEELGGGDTWVIKRIQHYIREKFIGVFVAKE